MNFFPNTAQSLLSNTAYSLTNSLKKMTWDNGCHFQPHPTLAISKHAQYGTCTITTSSSACNIPCHDEIVTFRHVDVIDTQEKRQDKFVNLFQRFPFDKALAILKGLANEGRELIQVALQTRATQVTKEYCKDDKVFNPRYVGLQTTLEVDDDDDDGIVDDDNDDKKEEEDKDLVFLSIQEYSQSVFLVFSRLRVGIYIYGLAEWNRASLHSLDFIYDAFVQEYSFFCLPTILELASEQDETGQQKTVLLKTFLDAFPMLARTQFFELSGTLSSATPSPFAAHAGASISNSSTSNNTSNSLYGFQPSGYGGWCTSLFTLLFAHPKLSVPSKLALYSYLTGSLKLALFGHGLMACAARFLQLDADDELDLAFSRKPQATLLRSAVSCFSIVLEEIYLALPNSFQEEFWGLTLCQHVLAEGQIEFIQRFVQDYGRVCLSIPNHAHDLHPLFVLFGHFSYKNNINTRLWVRKAKAALEFLLPLIVDKGGNLMFIGYSSQRCVLHYAAELHTSLVDYLLCQVPELMYFCDTCPGLNDYLSLRKAEEDQEEVHRSYFEWCGISETCS